MRNSKLGLRALGLVILGVLSLTALFAASAQAQLPGESKAGQFQINLAEALLATGDGTLEGTASLIVPGRNLRVHCTAGAVLAAKFTSSTSGLAEVLIKECVAWNLALTTKLPCTILSSGEPTGSVRGSGIGLPITHGGKSFVLVEPHSGSSFVEAEFHGATCPLPLVNPIKGSVAAEVVTNDVVKPSIQVSQAIQELSGDKLTFGGFPAFVIGSGFVELTGEHEGDTLGIL